MQTQTSPNLVGASRAEIAALVGELDPRPYRAAQVYHWVARRLAGSLDEMTNLPKSLRESLARSVVIRDPEIVEVRCGDEGTAKFALAYPDGAVIEAVAMPMEGHTTLCLSSQAGCAVGCVFCVTGVLGAGRNLSGGEIFGQYRADHAPRGVGRDLRQRRVHGHGRAAAQPAGRHARRGAALGNREPPPDHRLDQRHRARAREARSPRAPAQARGVAQRNHSGTAREADADRRTLAARGPARRPARVPARARPSHHVRIRHDRRHQRHA